MAALDQAHHGSRHRFENKMGQVVRQRVRQVHSDEREKGRRPGGPFEGSTFSVPTFVEPPPRLELLPLPPHPAALHWHHANPYVTSPGSQLKRLEQDMQRLGVEMDRLMVQSMARQEADMTRLWNQIVRDDQLDLNPQPCSMAVCRRPGHAVVPYFDSSLMPKVHSWLPRFLWGDVNHSPSWRQMENSCIENPAVWESNRCLQFDLHQFAPDEIRVTTDGRLLTVHARHEGSSDRRRVESEYFRQCTLPPSVEPADIVSQLSQSGLLSIYAPVQSAWDSRVKVM